MATRDQRGRFVKGNSGGPGRPTRRAEEEYLVALTDAVTLADWKKIVIKAVEDAKEGDHQARQWIGRYLIGDAQPDEVVIVEETEQLQHELQQVDDCLRRVLQMDRCYPTLELARVAGELLFQNRLGGVFETERDA